MLRQPDSAASVVAVTSANFSIPVLLGVLMLSGAAIGNTQQPNILWIITDDHRPDSIEAYNQATTGKSESSLGYVSSPNINDLAAEGVLFTHAYSNSPACGPSRTSMHTGRYPFRNGKYAWETTHQDADFARPAISQTLRDAGYGTAIIGKRHYGITPTFQSEADREAGLAIAPDIFDFEIDFTRDHVGNGISDLYSNGAYGLIDAVLFRRDAVETVVYPDGRVKSYRLSWADRELNEEELAIREEIEREFDILRAYTRINTGLILGGVNPRPAGDTIDANILKEFDAYLANADQSYETLWGKEARGADSSKPLFINLGFHLPHTPVLPPKSYRNEFMDRPYRIPEFDSDELAAMPEQMLELYHESKTDMMRPGEKLQAIRDYYAFAAYGDALIGDAVASFKAYSERTGRPWLIVFTVGDHGWHLGEQGIMAKFGPWKQSVNGAVVVVSSDKEKWQPGTVVHDLVEYVDFAPTFIAAAGLNTGDAQFDYLDGYDLAEVVDNPDVKRDYILGEMNLVGGHRAYLRSRDFAFSMRTRDRRTVAAAPLLNDDIRWALTTEAKKAHLALYDLRVYPLERHNVAATIRYRALAEWFRQKLGNIVLGDGRVEMDWSTRNAYNISNFADGADDKILDIPAELIPEIDSLPRRLERPNW